MESEHSFYSARSSHSSRSSYHRRIQDYLIVYLVKEIGLSRQVAHVLISIHDCLTLPETMDLFLINQNQLANHVFIPKKQQEAICTICEKQESQHQFTDRKKVQQILEQYRQIEENHSNRSNSSPTLKRAGSEINSRNLLRKQQQPRQTCEICYIEYPQSDLTAIKGTLHFICLQCMNTYIKQQISNMRVERILCPHCSLVLTPDVIQEFVDQATFSKYKTFLRNVQIQKNPHLKWCPNTKCSVVVSTNPNKKTSKCPQCGTQICNRCNRQAHPKSSCDSAFQKQINNWQNAADIQKCKKCQGLVEKIAGCNHMTCSICHFEWCWLCGSEYSTAHFSPLNPFGCPGLQDRPRDDWGKCKIVALRIGLLLLMIIATPFLLPLAMLACGPALIGHYMWNQTYPTNNCTKLGIIIFAIIFGELLNPIVWIGVVLYYTPKLCRNLCEYLEQRRLANQRREEFLQERFISADDIYEEKQVQK